MRILYVSPLKALNQDVWHNLQFPLEGILAESEAIGSPLPALRVAVRSGDTPAHERAAMVRKPPDILITTPESLHLMLTSRAREILRGISHVIVDEIHAVCGNKRGVFLALLLERLQAIATARFVRIGLSATQRPLDEVARYLGESSGPTRRSSARRRGGSTGHDRRRRLAPRPGSASNLAAQARLAHRFGTRSGPRSRGSCCHSCGSTARRSSSPTIGGRSRS